MAVCARSHLSDPALLRALTEDLARERGTTAQVLVDLAEVDARRLYVPAGFPSMFEFCLRALGFTRERAFKRIRAARMARRYPIVLERIANGSLSLSAVVLLAAHLTTDNAQELVAAASGRTIEELEQLLAARFPRPDLPTRIAPVPEASAGVPAGQASGNLLATGDAREAAAPGPSVLGSPDAGQLSTRTVEAAVELPPSTPGASTETQLSTWTVAHPAERGRVAPRSAERFAIQVTVGKRTYESLRRAQELLRHHVPSGDVAEVLDRALAVLVRELERRKFAATDRPRPPKQQLGAGANPRHVPASVKRAVWARDRGRCTFVSERGHRCEARDRLEFDHEVPVARGGRTTTGNIRLRCRAHNQYEAEHTFGAEFMRRKREHSRDAGVARTATPDARLTG